ncbi:MAG: EAL domain-containing protein (putative c-di-GMP-specific phosphodiesterase class I) [Enterobacterales bacterium]|jgi:EAL domain-containing protein (putative c-di-GMP-specific phosphodiesterase class I)/CheY-like chemotaxis protein
MTEVFIIDDEQQIAELLGETVSLSGFIPNIYTDARIFFEENKYSDDSIIMLDLNMPKMDGIEVIRELSKNGSKASLILMSGYDVGVLNSAQKLAFAYELEVMTSIKKPIQLDELMMVLVNHRKTLSDSKPLSDEHGFLPTEEELIEAIDSDHLILHYQPQINVQTGETIGAEALVRWMHPEHGMLFPDCFIPTAEQLGLMGKLTSKVLDIAITRISLQNSLGYKVPLSVNVSATNISSLDLPEELKDKIRIFKLDPSLLTIEITESALMGELVTSLDILTRIRMKGFGLSIDDFGTGFSSLSQLHRVPFNELKVDKSFVMEMDSDSEAKSIVKTCIMLGHELNMRLVAEGVESETTLTMLKQMGCDIAQGYFISHPLSEADFHIWLQENPSALCKESHSNS